MQLLSASPESERLDSLEDMVENVPMFGAAELRMSRDERPSALIAGVRVGVLASVSDTGLPLVDFPGNPSAEPVSARATIHITPADVRRGAVLMFEDGSPHRPILLGLLQNESASVAESMDEEISDDSPMWVEADGQRVVVSAEQELVLRCGKASITLTKAGKVLIRGAYLSSNSSGVNRIKGGSVQIN